MKICKTMELLLIDKEKYDEMYQAVLANAKKRFAGKNTIRTSMSLYDYAQWLMFLNLKHMEELKKEES